MTIAVVTDSTAYLPAELTGTYELTIVPLTVVINGWAGPEGLEAGTAKLVGTDADRIVAEVERLLDDEAAYAAMARAHNPFGDGHSAARIAELLANS